MAKDETHRYTDPPDEEIIPPEELSEDDLGPVPGQVVVRIARGDDDGGGVAAAETEFINSLPVYGSDAAGIQDRTGNAELDAALDTIGATALWRVQAGNAADVDEGLPELADLVLVEFDPNRTHQEAADVLGSASLVTEVSPSGGFSIAVVPNDPQFAAQWGISDVRCPAAWDITKGDPNVVVAILDTGCDLPHLDLSQQFANQGTNIVNGSQTAQDNHGHGTHVAGIVGARVNNGIDVAGVGWNTRLVPVKVLNGAGQVVGASIAQGIAWAATRCSVMNLSIQGAIDDLTLRSAMDGAQRLGVVVVAAMGNFGWGENLPSYPAAYAGTHDNVIAVGAVDRQHKRSVWTTTMSSNTGSWIRLAAPGTNILSTALGGGVKQMSGTSQACPHVAGAAALVRAVAPNLTAPQVCSVLTGTARPLRDNLADPVPNPAYGFGLLDVAAAVASASGGVAGDGDGGVDEGDEVDEWTVSGAAAASTETTPSPRTYEAPGKAPPNRPGASPSGMGFRP